MTRLRISVTRRVRVLACLGLLAAVLGFVVVQRSEAQLAANEVYVNTAFRLAWDHTGAHTNDYRLFRNGAQVALLPVSALSGGSIIFDQPGLALGSYTYRAEATGDGGVTPSANFVVVVKALPPAPPGFTLPRIIRIP